MSQRFDLYREIDLHFPMLVIPLEVTVECHFVPGLAEKRPSLSHPGYPGEPPTVEIEDVYLEEEMGPWPTIGRLYKKHSLLQYAEPFLEEWQAYAEEHADDYLDDPRAEQY